MPFRDFFNEQTSASSTRLMTFISLCAAIVLSLMNGAIAIYGSLNALAVKEPMDSINLIISLLLGFAGGAKVWQKYAEREKTEPKKEEEKI